MSAVDRLIHGDPQQPVPQRRVMTGSVAAAGMLTAPGSDVLVRPGVALPAVAAGATAVAVPDSVT
jgi:hypothetical protein